MGNPAIQVAIDGLAAIGIHVPASATSLIELLINEGEDVLSVIPKIISAIEQLGAEIWSTIEHLAAGIEAYGLLGFVQRQIEAAFDPHVETVRNIHMQKQTMLNNHRATLSTIKTNMQGLQDSQTFRGRASTAAYSRLNLSMADTSTHLDLLEQSLTVDQTFFTNIEQAKSSIAQASLYSLIILGIVLIVAGFLVLASAGMAALVIAEVGTLAITLAEAAILSIFTGCFLVWIAGHQLLDQSSTVTNRTFPMARPTDIPVPSELPPRKPRTSFTPEQEQLLDDLAQEFGWKGDSQKEAWLEYLIGMYGSSPEVLARLKSMIRCLYYNGYFDPQRLITNYQDQSATATVRRIWNTVTNALQPHDLEGAWKDYHGLPSGANHEQDINDTFRSLLDALSSLDQKIGDSRTPENLRAVYQALRNTVQATYDFVVKKVQGIDRPTSWSDQGNIPFSSDIFKNSGCTG